MKKQIIYLIKKYQSNRKAYHEKNPVFFQEGTDPKKKQKIDGSKFLKSSIVISPPNIFKHILYPFI